MINQRQDAMYVVETIEAFLDGTGGDWDWDDFTSCSLRDAQLDRIRWKAGAVELPLGDEGRTILETLLNDAKMIAGG